MYCIMRPYTEGLLDRYRLGIPRELSEIRTQPWQFHHQCLCFHIMNGMMSATCEP